MGRVSASLSFLPSPAIDDALHVNVVRAVFPLCVEINVFTVGHRVWTIEAKPCWQWDGFAKSEAFSSAQAREDVHEAALGLGHEPAHVGLVVRIGYSEAKEGAALRQDGFRQFVWTLTYEGKADAIFAPFLGDSLH